MDVLKDLESKTFLSTEQVSHIKASICKNYPHSTSQECALYFAQAVHHLLDQNLANFEKSQRQQIKKHVLQETISRESFFITSYDIFRACSTFPEESALFWDTLTDWLNREQATAFTASQVKWIASQALTPKAPPIASSYLKASPTHPLTLKELFFSYCFTTWAILKKYKEWSLACVLLLFLSLTIAYPFYKDYQEQRLYTQTLRALANSPLPPIVVEPVEVKKLPQVESPLQPHLQYKWIDEEALIAWLAERQSLLAEEPYFGSILEVAEEFNINPLLLFAITGQEQGFVPSTHSKASIIANNPFNVYGSWQDFNTNITDTSRIAARTILNLSKDCPPNEDPIKWLNRRYAEDPNWHIGVSQILAQLEKVAGESP